MDQPTGPSPNPPAQPSKKVTAAKTILSLFKKTNTHYVARYFLLGMFVFYSVLIFIGYRETTTGIKWWVVALTAMICNFLTYVKVVNERQRAVSIIFGVILEELSSGPHFVPWPMRLERATINSIKVDFGTIDDSKVERPTQGTDGASLYIIDEPIRINWGDIDSTDIPADKCKLYENNLYAHTLTTDPHLFFVMRISSLTTLIKKAGSLENALQLIKDTCVTALSEIAGRTFVAKAIREIRSISETLQERVEELVGDPQSIKRALGALENPDGLEDVGDGHMVSRKEILRKGLEQNSWGLEIGEVRLKDIGTPKRTNEAVADRAKAIAIADGEANATVITANAGKERVEREAEAAAYAMTTNAEAERISLTKIALGEANKTRLAAGAEKDRDIAVGTGRAAALTMMAKAVNEPGGKDVLKAQTLQKGFEYGKTVVTPLDQHFLTDIVALQETLKATGVAVTPTPSPTTP